MTRRSSRAVARYTDGSFTVVAEKRGNHHSYRVRAWFKGKPPTTEAAGTSDDAQAAAATIWRAYADGLFDNPHETPQTLGGLVSLFSGRKDLRPATRRTYSELLDRFALATGPDRSLSTVRLRDVQLWLTGLNCSPTSKATYLRTLKACFRWAVKQGYIAHAPTEGVSVPKVHHRIRPWLPHREWAAFLGACTRSLRPRARFALNAGLRKGELIHARWDWISVIAERPVLQVAPDPATGFVTKWGQARAVPLSRGAQQALEEARSLWGDEGYIFAADRLSDSNFAHRTRIACRKAGVTEVDFHGLRRSAGARWLELGFAMHEVSKLLGHQSVKTTERWYAGVGDRHLVRLFDRIDGEG